MSNKSLQTNKLLVLLSKDRTEDNEDYPIFILTCTNTQHIQ